MTGGPLEQPVTNIAYLWRLERRDGIAIGLTSHDRDLEIDGIIYAAAPGLVPSALVLTGAPDAEQIDLAGALSDERLRADDLISGRWDAAALSIWAVDWTSASDPLPLVRGEMGRVTVEDRGFEVSVRAVAGRLDHPVSEETSPTCRAEFGDRRCRVNLTLYRQSARAIALDDTRLIIDPPAAVGFTDGRVRWFSGANSGLDDPVLEVVDGALILERPPFHPVAAGDRIRITQGCDKSLFTCSQRFGNAINFRGEPHVPGNDLLTRYAVN